MGKFLPLVHLLIYEISYPNVFAKAVFFCLDKYNNLSIKAKENITIDLLENKKYGTNDVYHVLVNKKDRIL